MSTEFRLPELGENIAKGDLVKVLVSVGDVIAKDQAVIELETDKATLEVPSSVGGKIEQILVKPGEQVKVGQVILTVSDGAQSAAAGQSDQSSVAAAAQAKPKVNGAEAAKEEPALETQQTATQTTKSAPPASREAPAAKASGTVEFKLPELGENVEKGDLLKVLVSVGDTVSKEQPVLELETEKATLEVPSSVSGRVKEIHVKPGEKIKVGQLIFTLESDGGSAGAAPASAKAEKPASAPARASRQEAAPASPVAAAPAERPSAQPVSSQPPAIDKPAEQRAVPAAPSVRRMARELGVEISGVPGSGPGGRISADDVKTYIKNLNLARREAGPQLGASVPMPDFSRWGAVERESMRAVRRATASHLAHAWITVPRVTQHDRADITHIEKLRKQHSQKTEARGGKLTITVIALKVVASALHKFPQFAASIDPAREEIIYKKYRHIGVAVDTDRGLLVPVIRDVDKKNIVDLSVELAQVAEKARNRKLAPEDMEGGVFSISNLGGIGGTSFTPIVNWPEVAILGMSRSSLEPVYLDGQFEPRLILPLSLSYDHRLIDGADAARFLRWVAEALEQPFLIPFEG